MTRDDFVLMGITQITPEMVIDTGAKLEDVVADTISKADRVSRLCGLDIVLLRNGITTGDHQSETHKRGQAIDFSFIQKCDFEGVFKAMLVVGYHGIGVYWNGKAYSFHGDTRPSYAFWSAIKGPDGKWVYGKLVSDPRR